MTTAYEASAVAGELRPDGREVDAARWFDDGDLRAVDLNPFAGAMLTELGILDGPPMR